MTLSDQLVAALRQHLAGGNPVVPEAGRLLWGFFVELSSTRTYHMAGPNPISFAEIDAWARLHRWPLEPHHIEAIRALDRAWIEHAVAPQGTTPAGMKSSPRISSQPLTAAVFDAVFG